MDADTLEVRPLADPVPVVVEVGQMLPGLHAGDDTGIALDARQLRQHPRRRRRQRRQPRACLRIR